VIAAARKYATESDVSVLELDRLLAQLSVNLINLPAERLDDAFRDALRRVGESLAIDCATHSVVDGDGTLAPHAEYRRPGVPPEAALAPDRERFPWTHAALRRGVAASFSCLDEIPHPVDRDSYREAGIRSAATVPLIASDRVAGTVALTLIREERAWSAETLHRLNVFATALGSLLTRLESEENQHRSLEDAERRRDQLRAENLYLRAEARERLGTGVVVGQSAAVRQVMAQVQQVAATSSTVLLLGETGTGKELFATQIHDLSQRRTRPMVRVNCAAIPSALLESELFGREKGAYTGALARQVGRFELSDHSTIFLDEIGDLPLDVQVKLLRVLEERQVERLGCPKPIRVDTRIIAATHRNLEQRVTEGTFRDDLFYRLNVFPIQVPPLRERPEDVPLLVWRFVEEFAKAFGKRIDAIPRENLAGLQRYSWPGNIRELRNVVERAMITAAGPRLTIPVPAPTVSAARRSELLVDIEKEHIQGVLTRTGWRIRGSGGAAERLGLRPTTLETRLAKLGLKRQRP
jgi:transcriptional regulator with GAF, ATPase, and Fis domain